jgi:signal transduction histidine kinase
VNVTMTTVDDLPGVAGSILFPDPKASGHRPLARTAPRIAPLLGDARAAIRGLREDGPTTEALTQCADVLSDITGASIVVLTGGGPKGTWHASRPAGVEPASCLDRLGKRIPTWQRGALLPLVGRDAAEIIGRADVGFLVALPLGEETLGPEAVLLLAWGAGPYPSDDDLPAVRALADQIALSLAAAALDRELRTEKGGPAAATLPPADELISFFSHELRAPLTPMTMLLQTVERKAAKGTIDFEALTRAQRQIVRMTRLIGDVVDLSRLRQGKLRLERAPIELYDMLGEVVDEVRPTLHKHTLELEVVDRTVVSADRARLHRVVQNLLEQGERMSPNGGRLRIELRARDGRARIEVGVVATGDAPAHPPHKVEHIRQVGSYSQLVGPNLGIFLAEIVAERHGGRFSIEPGKGELPALIVELPVVTG